MYSAPITRLTPTAFCILIDQSGSMQEQVTLGSEVMTKAQAVGYVTNSLIAELVNRSRREDGVRDYFDIAVVGYGNGAVTQLLPRMGDFIKPSELSRLNPPMICHPREIVTTTGQRMIASNRERLWVEVKAQGDTPMFKALEYAHQMVERWCSLSANKASYPPTIFNITDGEASDADDSMLHQIADKIKALATQDGEVLLINIHIGSKAQTRVMFPSHSGQLPLYDPYARLLYDISSTMPSLYDHHIGQLKTNDTPPYRGMGYNNSIVDLISMMNIGSVSANIY